MAGEMDPKAAGELAENAKLAGKYAEEALDAFQRQLKVVTQMRDAMEEVAKLMQAISSQDGKGLDPESWKKVTKEVLKNEKASRSASQAFKEVSNSGIKLSKGLSIAGSAVSGLFQGFKNIVALGQGILGFFGSVAGGIFEVGKSILAIPFKMMAGLFKMASAGGSNELLEALENVRDAFGDLKSESSQAIVGTAKNIEKMNESGVPSYLIFGNLAGRIKAVTEMAQGMGAAFQVFQGEVAENGTAMMLYQRGLGITNEQMSTLASNALRMGKGIAVVQNEMTKQALGMSKAFGVNAKVISKDMAKAMSDLAHFGHLSTKELSVAATFANKLGVSVDKLTAIMDQTATYDQAAEGMSKLNEQYGTNIDATEMMMAQNPADKVELLRKAFAKTGKDMSQLTYQDRMFIKQQTGMSDELMNSAFAAKNAGVSLDNMRTQAEKAEKATMSQTEAIKALGDSIKRTFPSGGGISGGIMDHFLEGFFRGIQTSKEFIGMMMNIKQVLRIATQEGVKFGREFVNLFPGVKEIFSGLKEVFDPTRFRKMFDGVFKALDVFRAGGSGRIEDFVERTKHVFADFTGGGAGEKVKEGFKKFGKAVLGIVTATGEWVWKKMKELYQSFTEEMQNPGETTLKVKKFFQDVMTSIANFLTTEAIPFAKNAIVSLTGWLKDPDKFKSAMPPASGLARILGDIFAPLWEALKVAWKELYPVLRDLAIQAMISLKDGLWDAAVATFHAMSWKQIGMAVVVQFGPALISSLGTIIPLVIKAWPAIIQGLSVLFPTVASWFSGGFIAALTSGITSVITFITGGSLFAGMAVALVGTFVAVVGAAFAGIKLGNIIVDSLRKGYSEDVGSIQKDSDKFFDNLKEITNPEERIKKLQEAKEKSAQQLAETQDSWWRKTKDFFGGGDLLRASELNDQMLKKVLDQEKQNVEAARQQRLKEETVGTNEYYAKQEEMRKKALKESQEKALKDIGPITLDNAEERFKKIEALSKKIMGKDFDIKSKMEEVRKKLADVDFSLMDAKKEEQLLRATDQMQRIHSIFLNISEMSGYVNKSQENIKNLKSDTIQTNYDNLSYAITRALLAINMHDPALIELGVARAARISDIFSSSEKISEDINSFLKTSSKYAGEAISGSITKTLKAVEDMVAATQKMDDALSKVDKINIGARLTQVAGSMGIGAAGAYTVNSKDVVIHVEFKVSMDAQEIEKIMIGNNKSIIRDRINFALDKSDKGNKAVLVKSNPAGNTALHASGVPGSQ